MHILFIYGQRRLECNFLTPIGMENFFNLEFLCEKIEYKEDEEYILTNQNASQEVILMDNSMIVFDVICKN